MGPSRRPGICLLLLIICAWVQLSAFLRPAAGTARPRRLCVKATAEATGVSTGLLRNLEVVRILPRGHRSLNIQTSQNHRDDV